MTQTPDNPTTLAARGRRPALAAVCAVLLAGVLAGSADANEWGRFYHYPYSYYPQNFRPSFESDDYAMPYGYPAYPQRLAFPPYFRTDLYYPYLKEAVPGGTAPHRGWHQGNHFVLDVF